MRRGSSSRARRSDIFRGPRHPYTLGLLRSVPRLDRRAAPGSRPSRACRPNLRRSAGGLPLRPALSLSPRGVPAQDAAARAGSSRGTWPPASAGRDRQHARSATSRASAATSKQGVDGQTTASRCSTSVTSRSISPSGGAPASCASASGARRRRCELRHRAGRDARPGRRIRLRQDHDRPPDPAARDPTGGDDPFRRRRHHRADRERDDAPLRTQDPGDLPGSLLARSIRA